MTPVQSSSPRTRWRAVLPTLAAVAAVALFLGAARWQQGRMQEKERLRVEFDAATSEAPVALPYLPAGADLTRLRYRRVVATGAFDANHQILIDNKMHAGRAGYHVVTPLVLTDGRTVLVDRGWIAQGASRKSLPVAPPPPGTMNVEGRIAIPAAYLELGREGREGVVWQNLDPARYTEAYGIAVQGAVIEQTAPEGPGDGLVRDWPAPDFGVDTHRSYMLQWLAFAALTIVLWFAFHWNRLPRRFR